MKFSTESKPEFTFGIFFCFTQFQILKESGFFFFKFQSQSICTLTTKATDNSIQFQCGYIVFGDKTKLLRHVLKPNLNKI